MTTGLLLTTLGQAAIATDLGGGADLVLTHVAFGDSNGTPYTPNAAQAALVNERYRAPIASVAVVAGALVIDAVIPADTPDASARPSHSFNIAEAGLISAGGVLVGVARMSNGYKPPPSSGQAMIASFRFQLAVANPSAITVVIDPQAQVNVGRQVRPFWLAVDGVLNAPPGSPAVGATYVIGAAPTGAWAGFAHRLAQWVGVWALSVAPEGHHVCDVSKALDDAERYLRRTSSGWTSARASETAIGLVQLATVDEAKAGNETIKVITPATLRAALGTRTRITLTGTGTYTVPADRYTYEAELVGGGGGGGGADILGAGSGGNGGDRVTTGPVACTPGAGIAYARGAGGTAGTTASNGGDGGDTSFGPAIARGGRGGATAAANAEASPLTPSATSTGGVVSRGQLGKSGMRILTSPVKTIGGEGGSSPGGGLGGQGARDGGTNGNPGVGAGGGGGAGAGSSGTGRNGGTGDAGSITIWI